METKTKLRFVFWPHLNMVDVFTIAFAVVTLAAVARRLFPARPITLFFLALLTGAWIWANLRDSGWQEVWGEGTPDGVRPSHKSHVLARLAFAPFMICIIHGNRFRSGGLEGLALVFDWLVLFFVLSLARLICERWSHRRDGRTRAANLCAVQRAFGKGGQNS